MCFFGVPSRHDLANAGVGWPRVPVEASRGVAITAISSDVTVATTSGRLFIMTPASSWTSADVPRPIQE